MSFLGFIARIYFHKIIVKGSFPKEANFYLSNHRNGAVDGFVFLSVFKHKIKTILGKNLTHSWFMRLFFGRNIEIYRRAETKDQMRHNQKELKKIPDYIKDDTSVLMFPEGTSHLNKGLLPIKKGASLVTNYLDDSRIVPIGLHYEKGWAFRSNVVVTIGEPVKIEGKNLSEKTEDIKKHLSSVFDDDLVFEKENKNLFLFFLLSPLILAFFLLNAITILIPYVVSKKFADDLNVIALWRLLSGVPCFALQTLIYLVVSFYLPWMFILYVLVSLPGLLLWRKWKFSCGLEK